MRGAVAVAVVVVVVYCALACVPSRRAPPRPFGVPSSSAWAGGADGGTWIDCWRASDVLRAKDGAAHAELDARFDCSLYDERGAIQRKGRFRMLDVDDAGALHPAADARRIIRFDAYDGCRVLLSDKRVLTLEQYTSCSDVLCTNHC